MLVFATSFNELTMLASLIPEEPASQLIPTYPKRKEMTENVFLVYLRLLVGGFVGLLIIWLGVSPFFLVLFKPRQMIEITRRLGYFFTPELYESRRLQDEKQTEQSLSMVSCVGLVGTLIGVVGTCGLIYVICNAMWQVTPH
jgi:hypothetical protein